MEATRTSETSVDFQLRTRQYIPEDSELYTRRRENLKSHIVLRCPLLISYGLFWLSNLASPNSGLKNLICAASRFLASLFFMIQFSLPQHKLALDVTLRSRNFVSVVTCFPTSRLIIQFII
jgi:hypothetical protein